MKDNIKLIVTDLDGTLLKKDKTVSDRTIKTLHECQKRGIIVAFATARSENSGRRYIELVKPDAVVSSGGALARANSKVVYSKPMNIETTNQIVRQCLENSSVGYITVDTSEGFYVNKPVDENDPGWASFVPVNHIDFSKDFDSEAYKITVETWDDIMHRNISSALPTVHVIRLHGEGWIHFADKAASKLQGVKALADHYDIRLEEVVAFGDDYNDLEMLKGCGIGVAVNNAINEAKESANYICDYNENDGVAKWIEENLL